ncbi:AsiA anti-sigma 70 protein [Aeromonas phage Aeh1]|uniref:AsiA anti-sigma 70 protein n=1 Tax=Aeromonas phage Aeh1 TaxID=2880362 RepID=Q76YA4_9CAUD|nr:anti-sigma factor [Aeromonas phage Aeh1]AAQ17991.1 AsiA anti-sigma 70 protein [Aeromonas phage Aeh1]
MNAKLELIKDIVATVSLIIKLEVDGEILDTQQNLIDFLNEAGFRTVRGLEFTKMSFRQMIGRLTPAERIEILSEFSAQEHYEMLNAMLGPRGDVDYA